MASDRKKAFLLRIPSDLWADLEKWAADELRSVNGQIGYLLRQAAAKRKGDAAARPGKTQTRCATGT